jgi:hypothetical protein
MSEHNETDRAVFDGNHRPDGRFAPGNRASRGNPLARRMFQLRRSLLDAADPEAVARVGRKLAALAEAGDVQAAKVWLDYVVGRPAQAVELSGPAGEPLGVDLGGLHAALMATLAPFPEARVRVALALKGLADESRDVDQTGDGA